MIISRLTVFCVAALLFLSACGKSGATCPPDDGVVLQVLGSGGPIADDGRASSSYLVWVDGVARVLIDAGSGAFLRFGESGARFEDLDFVGLSHFHTDHSADFPALLKSGSFSRRERPLYVSGPSANGSFPSLKDWLQRMLNADAGAYAYLSGFLDGTQGQPMLIAKEVTGETASLVYKNDDLSVEALTVPHGIVPAVAFKVTVNGETLVFASDQNGSKAEFTEFARDASILVMHLVVPETAEGVASRLHARPSVVGAIGNKAKAGTIVLSHFMARSLKDIDKNVALVRKSYGGRIILAEDRACVAAGR